MIELTVGPVAHGGVCVARHEGQVVFVRHALPGERVMAEITDEGQRFLRADAVEILERSPDRVVPPCPYAGPGRCGGCDWQHASLPAQRRLKADVIREQFTRLAGITPEVTVEELPGSPDGLGWRTRVQFAVRPDGVLGLRRHRSHEIEPVEFCLIAHEGVEALGVERERWPGAERVEAIAAADDLAVVVTPKGRRSVEVPPLDADASILVDEGRGRVTAAKGSETLRERAGGRVFEVTGSGFWQVHPSAAGVFLDTVLALGRPGPGETVLDLYCGAGLFTAGLAQAVGPSGLVVGIESDPTSARDARRNLRDLPQARIERGRVEQRQAMDHADLVVVDPPRAGLGRAVVARIAELTPSRIVYVSCDPATLARDVAWLAGHGYRLDALRAFDAFPMTQHVECVALLTRA
ncbi:class I SAM-dependent RNA methyltransferase [Bailinhaonella thermotolerans]|uniref:Class I SAM-dependent RNA methyltransferase n=1 Tax=Bailinhaonella thermotolerans TaxID=1070861 RepID=A0A3A4AWF0_9ACTN|nr:class I SAM-dependent RNA methyltransferase [Bailinhaonella thermotolerans]RJL34235.1 class I SAM-dependent RNA methyltransferase [Bailinhaonella thermotolerans]